MNLKEVLEDLKDVKRANESFMKKYDDEPVRLIIKENATEEELLMQEILLELTEKMNRINRIISYIEGEPGPIGTLSRDASGRILFDGKPVPMMKEFEILVEDEELGQRVWMRTYVSFTLDGDQQFLLGQDKDMDIDGVKARFRK